MKLYKVGKVFSLGKTYLIFETNQTGIIINVNYPEHFEINKEIKIFIYEYQSDYLRSLFGFRTFKERIIFEDLLGVSGIGPKSAMNLLKIGHKKLVEAIINRDLAVLSQVKAIGSSMANHLITSLRAKYMKIKGLDQKQILPGEISSSLKTLGFNSEQIRFAINKLSPDSNLEIMIEKAIVIIASEYQNTQVKV